MATDQDEAVTRDALVAIREALDIPYAATIGWAEKRAEVLDRRLADVLPVLRNIETVSAGEIAWHTAYLRKRIAKLPADGYVTSAEARAAVEHGMSWSDAVAEPRDCIICGPDCCSPVLAVHTSCPGPHVGATVVSVR